ncbi:MAG: RNA pseudouridine synthase [Oscillospiraceae bacterium]|jgi:23S rRNA pseudouridine1911/1915/1917 synthase|nr:RNA pseudouridine synthase [Oscillospiraceae bacterium]
MTHRDTAVLHCDNHLLVAVKPPNLPAQADRSGDIDMLTLMKSYIKETYQKPGAVYLGLVHRLDRPVGGLMAFARTSKAAARLSEQLRAHAMRRSYLAIVRGEAADAARLSHLLDRPEGAPQEAALSFICLARREGLSLLRIELETGRKHQIRRQLSLCGLPIWGDARYGAGQPGQQIALWGTTLTLTHPTTRELLSFDVPPPRTSPWSLFST